MFTSKNVTNLKARRRALGVGVKFSDGGTQLTIGKSMLFHPFSESYFVREIPNFILFGYH